MSVLYNECKHDSRDGQFHYPYEIVQAQKIKRMLIDYNLKM